MKEWLFRNWYSLGHWGNLTSGLMIGKDFCSDFPEAVSFKLLVADSEGGILISEIRRVGLGEQCKDIKGDAAETKSQKLNKQRNPEGKYLFRNFLKL